MVALRKERPPGPKYRLTAPLDFVSIEPLHMNRVRVDNSDTAALLAVQTKHFQQHTPTIPTSGESARRSSPAIFRAPLARRGAPRFKIRVGPALGGAPRNKRGVARAPRGAAQAAGGAPRAIWAAPQVIGGGPLLVWAAPLLKRAAPRTLRGTPHLKNRAPRAKRGAPRGVWGGALFAEKRPFSTKNAVLPPFQP